MQKFGFKRRAFTSLGLGWIRGFRVLGFSASALGFLAGLSDSGLAPQP